MIDRASLTSIVAHPAELAASPPNDRVCLALALLASIAALALVLSHVTAAAVSARPALAVAVLASDALVILALVWWRARSRAHERARDDRTGGLTRRIRLLESVIENAPAALILCDIAGQIALANAYANELLSGGASLEGQDFQSVLDRFPPEMRAALGQPSFVVVDHESGAESYHVSSRDLSNDQSLFKLHLLRRVTDEVNRQEVDVWKKVIRVFSHELNNSLAPIASLTHSARHLAGKPDKADKQLRILDAVRERTQHLEAFLSSYARFAKLPRPNRQPVPWAPFLTRLQTLAEFTRVGHAPATPGYFDEAQLEQVLLNLIKNAHEAGSDADAVTVAVEPTAHGVAIRVMDRGPGMSPERLLQAHLPFYSTKRTGTGLGLALCHDIVVAHGGRLQLQHRDGGGLVVTCWLPAATEPDAHDSSE